MKFTFEGTEEPDAEAVDFLKDDVRTSSEFKRYPDRAKSQSQLKTYYDEEEEAYKPVGRMMIGASHTLAETEDYIIQKEQQRREKEKTSFLDALRH